MQFCVCAADIIFSVLESFLVGISPPENVSLDGALFDAFGQIGRAVGLAIVTAVQTAIITRQKGISVLGIGNEGHCLLNQLWTEPRIDSDRVVVQGERTRTAEIWHAEVGRGQQRRNCRRNLPVLIRAGTVAGWFLPKGRGAGKKN
jgi:hypothetical protein